MQKSARNEYLSARKDPYISILKNSLKSAVCLIFYKIFLVSMSQKPISGLGADVIGAIEGNPALNEAYEMGKTIS